MPRRDRAYVVGDHGMVFRYRVVPLSHPLGPNDKDAPAMPGFESALDEQVGQLEGVVGELATQLSAASPTGSAGASAAAANGAAAAGGTASGDSAVAAASADSATGASEPLDAPLPPPSPFTANCCKKSFNRLETILGALSQTLPEFIGKYKNLNLLLAAVRMGAELPAEYRSVKGGLRSFRKAQDKESATAALAGVSAALSAFKQTTSVSMQQELPPPPSGDAEGAPSAGLSPVPNADSSAAQNAGTEAKTLVGDAAAEAKSALKDSTKASGKDAMKGAADKAKKGLGGLLRKKKP
jgi:hypothetical protein